MIRTDEVRLSARHLRIIIRDHDLPIGVVRIRRIGRVVVMFLRSSLREGFVVPYTILPTALPDGVEGLAWSVGVEECAAIQRHAEDDFLRGDVRHVDVVVQRRRGVEWCTLWVGWVRVDVCLMPGDLVPGTGVVVSKFLKKKEVKRGTRGGERKSGGSLRHQVPEVEILIHCGEMHL